MILFVVLEFLVLLPVALAGIIAPVTAILIGYVIFSRLNCGHLIIHQSGKLSSLLAVKDLRYVILRNFSLFIFFLVTSLKLKLVGGILFKLLLTVNLSHYLYTTAKDIDILSDSLCTVRKRNLLTVFGHAFIEVGICLYLIRQAAHKLTAHSRYLTGVKREILFLCHLNGNRNKISHVSMTAQLPAAGSHSAQYPCGITHTYLSELYPCMECTGQILYQLPEIHPAVCGKIKRQLISVETVLGINELHFEPMISHLFLADPECIFLKLYIFLVLFGILFRCHSHNGL